MAAPIEIADARRGARTSRSARRAPCRDAAGAAAARHGPAPRHADPLAVGQERSIELVNDVLRGDRMLVMVARATRRRRRPGPTSSTTSASSASSRACSRCPTARCGSSSRAASACASTAGCARSPTSSAEISELPDVVPSEGAELTALMRNVQQTFSRIIERTRTCPRSCRSRSPTSTTRARSATSSPARCASRPRRSRRCSRRSTSPSACGGSSRSSRASSRSSRSARRSSRRSSPRSTRASASTCCASSSRRSGGARRVRRVGRRGRRAARAARRDRAARGRPPPGRPRALAPGEAAAGGRRARRHPHLPGVDRLAAVGQARPRTTSTSSTRARCSTRTTTTSSRSRTASSSSSPCASSSPTRAARSCASSARPAWARPRSGARSRARWGASSSASAPAACATRPRSAATGAPTSARCPGTIIRALRDAGSNNPLFMIDEIDKMGADYRGDPASAMLEVLDPEQNADLPRPLPRRAVRPLGRHVHHHREHARHDPRAAARPHGGHPARGLHRGGEAPDRQALPRAAPDRAQRPEEVADLVHRRRAAGGHPRLHARGGRAQPRARDRHACAARSRARWRRPPRTASPRRTAISEPRVRELLGRPRFSSETKRRTRQPGVATGLAWTPVGGDVLFIEATAYPGKGKLTITGQLGDVMRESAQAALSYVRSHSPSSRPELAERVVRRARHPHPRARGRDPEGRARARASRWPPRWCRCSPGAPCATTSR